MTKQSPTLFPYTALLIGLISIAFSGIFISSAGAPGTVTAFYRMFIAAAVVALPFFWQNRSVMKSLSRQGVLLAVLGGVLFAVDLAFWSTGIDYSGATRPTLMANTAPLWVGLGSLILFHERQSAAFWVGLLIAIFGAALVLGADLAEATEVGLGTFLGLLAAIFYGAYYLVTQRGRGWLNTLAYFWITTFSSAVVLFLLNMILGRSLGGYDRTTWLYFLAVGIIVQLLGWFSINYAQGYIPASLVAPTLLLQPVITAVLAVLILSESFSPWNIIGGLIVLVGVFVVHRSRPSLGKNNEIQLEEEQLL
ncbi:MAG: DMT family transporter [Candidatus Promineifilaceae bacterium]